MFGLLGQIIASWSNTVRALIIIVVAVATVVGAVVVRLKVLNADVTAGPVSIVGRATPAPIALGGLPWEARLRLMQGPAGQRDRAANFEVKCFDLRANPYLVVAALLFAGLAGIDACCAGSLFLGLPASATTGWPPRTGPSAAGQTARQLERGRAEGRCSPCRASWSPAARQPRCDAGYDPVLPRLSPKRGACYARPRASAVACPARNRRRSGTLTPGRVDPLQSVIETGACRSRGRGSATPGTRAWDPGAAGGVGDDLGQRAELVGRSRDSRLGSKTDAPVTPGR